MDLWIRSQNKTGLIKVKHIEIGADNCIYALELGSDYEIMLGKYKKKKRAIEVLDEIQNLLIDRYVVDKEDYLGSDVFMPSKDAEIKVLPRTCVVYQMPADDEAK